MQEGLERKRLRKPIGLGNMVAGELDEGSVNGMVDGRGQDLVE